MTQICFKDKKVEQIHAARSIVVELAAQYAQEQGKKSIEEMVPLEYLEKYCSVF